MKYAFLGLVLGVGACIGLSEYLQHQQKVEAHSVASRGKRAFLALLQTGIPPRQAANFVADRLGIQRREARRNLKRMYGRRLRDGDSIRTRYVGVVARTIRKPLADEAIAMAICYPLANCEDSESLAACLLRADTTFAPALAQCLARQADSLTEPLCDEGTSIQRGWGARVRLTNAQAARLAEHIADNGSPNGLWTLNNAVDRRYFRLLAQRGIERCPVQ